MARTAPRGARQISGYGEGPVIGKRIEITALRKDGSEFPVELSITPVPAEGPPSFTGYLRDIPHQKKRKRNAAGFSPRSASPPGRGKGQRMKGTISLDRLGTNCARPSAEPILGWSQILGAEKVNEETSRRACRYRPQTPACKRRSSRTFLLSRIISGRVRLTCKKDGPGRLIHAAIEAVQRRHRQGIRLQTSWIRWPAGVGRSGALAAGGLEPQRPTRSNSRPKREESA